MPDKNYKKIIGFWLMVFLVGGASGVFLNRVVLPWAANLPSFNKFASIYGAGDTTTIINKTDKIYISQETAYQDAVNRVGDTAVAVLIGAKPVENSGFILTGDGLIATANFSAPKGSKILVARDGKQYDAQLVKQDKDNGLALLKINENNLPVVDFKNSGDLRLGEKVFLAGAAGVGNDFYRFANLGFIRTLAPEISFTFSDSLLANGAPLGDVEGKVLGLALVDRQGNISMIGSDKIKALLQ